jgi:hypothetical protein
VYYSASQLIAHLARQIFDCRLGAHREGQAGWILTDHPQDKANNVVYHISSLSMTKEEWMAKYCAGEKPLREFGRDPTVTDA